MPKRHIAPSRGLTTTWHDLLISDSRKIDFDSRIASLGTYAIFYLLQEII